VRDRLRVSQSSPYVYFRYTPCLTDFTFEFIRRPIPPILSPTYWTFVELTLVTGYSRSTRVNSALAMKPPMLSISLVTKLPLARGCLCIWVTLPLPRTEMK
jgi:hypothetical protein